MKKNRTLKIAMFLIAVAIIMIIVALMVNFFSTTTVRVSTAEKDIRTSSLRCVRNKTDQSFFDLSGSNTVNEEIKLILQEKNLEAISYDLDVDYAEPDLAKTAEAEMHAKYNLYIKDHSIEEKSLSSTFSVVDNNKVKVELYADGKKINNAIVKLFLLDSVDQIKDLNSEDLKNIYMKQGFICEIND